MRVEYLRRVQTTHAEVPRPCVPMSRGLDPADQSILEGVCGPGPHGFRGGDGVGDAGRACIAKIYSACDPGNHPDRLAEKPLKENRRIIQDKHERYHGRSAPNTRKRLALMASATHIVRKDHVGRVLTVRSEYVRVVQYLTDHTDVQ